MALPETCIRIVLAERPKEHITASTFKKEIVKLSQPGNQQALVQVQYLSIDPAMRGWLSTYEYSIFVLLANSLIRR